MTRMHNPPHSGEVLQDYLEVRSVSGVAQHIGVSLIALTRP